MAVRGDTKPKRIRRTPEAARAHILESARVLLAEHGPDAIGLKEIAQQAGISHALINHYFGSYEALVDEVIWTEVRTFRDRILAQMKTATELSPAGWLNAALDEFTQKGRGRLMLWAMISGRLSGPDAFPRREQGLRKTADVIEERLTEAFGGMPFSRLELETLLVVALASTWGYAIGRDVLWSALGRKHTPELDSAFREKLSALLLTSLAGGPRRA